MSKTITTLGRPSRLPIDHLVWIAAQSPIVPCGPGTLRITTTRQRATVVSLAGRSATVSVNGRWYTVSVHRLEARRS